jgi:hypothetical protein
MQQRHVYAQNEGPVDFSTRPSCFHFGEILFTNSENLQPDKTLSGDRVSEKQATDYKSDFH